MKSGVLIIDKDKNMTSRNVVDEVGKILGSKKVGHTGTLDPLATGVLVICVNEGTKIIEFITSDEKEYIAEAQIGIETDTLDITGNVLKKEVKKIDKETLIKALNHFKGEYLQEVPIYSAVRVNGKRLYEYARSNTVVELPKRVVNIKEIELLEYNESIFKFRVVVSKGTYIRSLIRDIGNYLNVPCTMTELRRTRQGIFKIEDAIKLSEVSYDKLISINEALENYPVIKVNADVQFKVKNGVKLEGIVKGITRIVDDEDRLLALYDNDLNNNLIRSVKVFNNNEEV